jgi:hypothetical protein
MYFQVSPVGLILLQNFIAAFQALFVMLGGSALGCRELVFIHVILYISSAWLLSRKPRIQP